MLEGDYRGTPMQDMLRKGVAELLGTMFLVGGGTLVVVSARLERPIAGAPPDSLTIALAFGLILGVVHYAFKDISGSHFNTVVTIALAIAKKFEWRNVPIYGVCQLLGAILGSKSVQYLYGADGQDKALLGATLPAEGVSDDRAFIVEAAATFLLVTVVFAVGAALRESKAVGSVVLAFTLTGGILIAGPFTGGSLNPVRSLGPMIVLERYDALFIYMAGPMTGGILAAVIFGIFLTQANKPS